MSTKRPYYYDAADLARFSEISRINPELGKSYFEYYGKAMGPGALSEREKALIALAVAHALKCPYCIDAYSQASLEKGADPEQMSEAVHVAAAMAAGITLVHSVQMMNKVDELSI
jgi:alkylhydroperoxidase/carboxymuconolactone decarboxylase family protein